MRMAGAGPDRNDIHPALKKVSIIKLYPQLIWVVSALYV